MEDDNDDIKSADTDWIEEYSWAVGGNEDISQQKMIDYMGLPVKFIK
jgi:hypothetical protein